MANKAFKLLVADDDPGILEFYKSLLPHAGYELRTANEATGAIMLFKEERADLLILDVAMPSGGGRQIMDIVRGLVEEGVPIIFITGLPEKIVPWIGGMKNIRVMQKPVAPKALLDAIAAMLPAKA